MVYYRLTWYWVQKLTVWNSLQNCLGDLFILFSNIIYNQWFLSGYSFCEQVVSNPDYKHEQKEYHGRKKALQTLGLKKKNYIIRSRLENLQQVLWLCKETQFLVKVYYGEKSVVKAYKRKTVLWTSEQKKMDWKKPL